MTRVAIAILEAALPPRLAEPVVGDLLEAHAHQPIRFWFEALCALRLASLRVPAAALLGATLAWIVGIVAFRWTWRFVLHLVPLRAAHDPPLDWIVPFVVLTACVAVAGAFVGARLAQGASR